MDDGPPSSHFLLATVSALYTTRGTIAVVPEPAAVAVLLAAPLLLRRRGAVRPD